MSNKRAEDHNKSIFSVIIASTPLISSITSCALEAERVAGGGNQPHPHTYDGGEVAGPQCSRWEEKMLSSVLVVERGWLF